METHTLSTDGEARIDGGYDYGNEATHKNYVEGRPNSENQIFHNEWNTDGSPGYYGSWDDVIPKLTDDRELTLEDILIKKDTEYNPLTGTLSTDGLARTDGDYDYIDNEVDYNEADPIIQLKIKNKFDNHQKLVERPDNREDEARTDGVFPNNEWNDDGSPGYYGSWDDVIPKIPDSKNQNPIYEQLLNLKEDELYEFVLQLLNDRDNDSDLNVSLEWREKMASLVTTYLDPRKTQITPQNAHRFESELFRSIRILDENAEGGYREERAELSRNTDGEARIDGNYDYIDNNPLEGGELECEKNRAKNHQKKVEMPITGILETDGEARDGGYYDYIDYTDTTERIIKHHQVIEKMNSTFNEKTRTLETDSNPRTDNEYDYINYNNTTEAEVDEHTKDQYKNIPFSQIPDHGSLQLPVEYIRYMAELTVGNVNNATVRKYLLSATLWSLILARHVVELASQTYRSRLPGNTNVGYTIVNDINSIYQSYKSNPNIIDSALNASMKLICKYIKDKPNPINRPKIGKSGEKETTEFEYGNSRTPANSYAGDAAVTNSFLESIKNSWDNFIDNFKKNNNFYNFGENYLQGRGIATTLSDLCNINSINNIGSLEDLLKTLRTSDYITTPEKFGTTKNRYGTQTLDSNAYWELIIEPYCDRYLNGGYSFLPSFQEINAINYLIHGVTTSYNKWIPIVNFELQKSKLTTKSIGLFDGEFSFPLSAEFTNELRMTIVDDQYKSWRHYFQKCMDVAVFNSKSHKDTFYTDLDYKSTRNGMEKDEIYKKRLAKIITPVDKTITCVSFYKNITFRIRIYIMTPQYSTIRRFDLLCVLKDFMEEYSGDIDAGGVDLNVTFSIVGENPGGAEDEQLNKEFLGDLKNEIQIEKNSRPRQASNDDTTGYLNIISGQSTMPELRK